LEHTPATLAALQRAAEEGIAALAQGYNALRAATETLWILEDDPAVNAG